MNEELKRLVDRRTRDLPDAEQIIEMVNRVELLEEQGDALRKAAAAVGGLARNIASIEARTTEVEKLAVALLKLVSGVVS